jgi:nucleotide-binding universal stress UspA family protein
VHIATGVDGSQQSLRALRWAWREARAHDAALQVACADTEPILGVVPSGGYYPDPLTINAQLEMMLREAVAGVRAAEGGEVEVTTTVVSGEAAPALLAAAAPADLLVVGARGMGGFKRRLLGSVSQRCVQHATCTVVVVPAKGKSVKQASRESGRLLPTEGRVCRPAATPRNACFRQRPITPALGGDSETKATVGLRPSPPQWGLMVPAAIPFAVAAAFFPAGLAVVLWLLDTPPRLRRGLVYLAGAATTTIGSGLVMLGLLHGIETGPGRRASIEGYVQIVLGVAFLAFSVGLLIRRPRLEQRTPLPAVPRLRAGGYVGIFLLGMAMWTPSLAYVAAIDLIVDSPLNVATQLLNLLLVDVIVLASIEVPLVLYVLAPRTMTRTLTRLDAWVRRYGWQLGSLTAGGGGMFLVVRGCLQLT